MAVKKRGKVGVTTHPASGPKVSVNRTGANQKEEEMKKFLKKLPRVGRGSKKHLTGGGF